MLALYDLPSAGGFKPAVFADDNTNSVVRMKKPFHHLKWALRKVRRAAYQSRAFIPSLREQHRIEQMVGPVGLWDKLRAYQFNALKAHGLAPHHSLLDIGCGPLQGGVAFIDYLDQGKYAGVDAQTENLSAAYGQIRQHNLSAKNPWLIRSDSFGDEELGERTFDFFWASQVLYYFNAEVMQKLLQIIAKRINPGGRFLGDIVGHSHPDFQSPTRSDQLWDLQLHSVESIRRWAEPLGLMVRSAGEIANYGYPASMRLRTNILIEVTPLRTESWGIPSALPTAAAELDNLDSGPQTAAPTRRLKR